MASSEEIVRLILDLGGNAQKTEELIVKLQGLKRAGDDVAASYHMLATAGEGFDLVEKHIVTDLDRAFDETLKNSQALRQMNQLLSETSTTTVNAGAGINQHLVGQTGKGGFGILGASYAFQDFTSQIQNGFVPAMGSIQNNIPQILMGTGLSNPMIGAISAISVVLTLGVAKFAEWYKAAGDSDAVEKAKKRLEEFEARIKSINAEFAKLANAASDPEKESAGLISEFLSDRPNAEGMKRSAARGFKDRGDLSMLSPEERKQMEAAQGDVARPFEFDEFDPNPAKSVRAFEAMKEKARGRIEQLKQAAAGRRGEDFVNRLTRPGEEGRQARGEMAGLGTFTPDQMRAMRDLSPEGVEAQDNADRAWDEKMHNATESAPRRRANEARDRQLKANKEAAATRFNKGINEADEAALDELHKVQASAAKANIDPTVAANEAIRRSFQTPRNMAPVRRQETVGREFIGQVAANQLDIANEQYNARQVQAKLNAATNRLQNTRRSNNSEGLPP